MIFVLSIIIKLSINRLVTNKLEILSDNINKFKNDKYLQETIKINSNDEIEYLSDEFNSMKNNLQNNWKKLEDINKNLQNSIKVEIDKNTQKEIQILEQSKLAQMGEMIGNIAHQWRQPLSVISTTASGMLIKKDMNILNDNDFKKYMENIISKTKYLSDTIDTFSNFIKTDLDKQEIRICDVIDESINIIGKTLESHGITFQIELNDKLSYYGYKGELSQIVINILNNAKDAFVTNTRKDKVIRINLSKDDNKNAIITIQDNAGGIPEDIIGKIFDPYFSTKHKSQGIGIGLYMCTKLVKERMNGSIWVNNIDNGAEFTIQIPYIS